jgi:hypothetical protein
VVRSIEGRFDVPKIALLVVTDQRLEKCTVGTCGAGVTE